MSVLPDSGVDVLTLREPRLTRRIRAVARSSVVTRPAVATVLDALAVAAR
jgi:hypothetical protein